MAYAYLRTGEPANEEVVACGDSFTSSLPARLAHEREMWKERWQGSDVKVEVEPFALPSMAIPVPKPRDIYELRHISSRFKAFTCKPDGFHP
eukprot:7076291-Pyramimonas_sp.AAC.1